MGSQSTFVAYIDESGNEGFRFDAGSTAWFVLAAVLLRRANEVEQVKLIDEVRSRINQEREAKHRFPERKALHFRDLRHEPRKFYAARLAQADLRTMCVLIHKPDLTSPESFTGESRLYFYAVRLLVERISWYCRDNRRKDDTGDGSTELVFSNRATMDYDALRQYVEHLERNRVALDFQAAPGILRSDQIVTYTHGRRMGLQLADAVASAYYYAVQPSGYGFTEDAYARLLLPRAYRHEGRLWGYGLKIMPREAEEQRRAGVIFPAWEP